MLGGADREKMVSAVTLVGQRGMKPRESGLQKILAAGVIFL